MTIDGKKSNSEALSTGTNGRSGRAEGKRESNRKKRHAALLKAALERFLRQGVETTTIAEITTDAKTAKGSFYGYFQDKSDVVRTLFLPLAQLMDEVFAEADRNLETAESGDQLSRAYNVLGMRLVPAILVNRDLVRLYLQESRGAPSASRQPIEDLRQRIDQAALHLTKAAHKHGIWREFPAQVSAFAVVGAVEKSLYSLLNSDQVVDPVLWTKSLVSLILDGLSPRD
jgi:AcrR family transcriptional regulator